MFKKIMYLSLIALILFSTIATNSAATLTVHARTQDNDGDGLIILQNSNHDELSKYYIKKGETLYLPLNNVERVRFESVGKRDWAYYAAFLDYISD